MKVLHLLAGLSEASGVANVARRIAQDQRERGDEVVLLSPAGKWNPIYFGAIFACRAWRMARSADEIWVHCSWTFPVWFGAWLSSRYGKKLVVKPDGSFDPKRMNNHAFWKKRLVMPLDRWVLRKADEVLALCQEEVKWVQAFEPAAKVRFERVPIYCKGVKKKAARDKGPLHVLFLGRKDDALKGVRFLKQAVAEIDEAAANGPLIELKVESGLFGKAKEQAWEWCDVLCLPTLSENFGLVVAEALEHGRRVITTDGAPAWDPSMVAEEEGAWWKDELIYLKGFRNGTDETRVRLLKDALLMMHRRLCSL